MKYKIMSKFIVITFRVAQFFGAALFVWGVVGFTDTALTWDSHYMLAIQILVGYYVARARTIQDVIDEFDLRKTNTKGLDAAQSPNP